MCGIVGIISKRPNFGFSNDELAVFNTLLLVDALRGEDSTGVFGVDNDSNVYVAKSAEISGTFLQTQEFEDIRRKMFSKGFALIGHNRKATRGNITDENAHPFTVNDEVVLVHNGTWFGDHKHIANTEVDSHAFAHAIHEAAPDEVEEAFSRVNAAYATIWYDVRDKSINFARNNQRPLYYLATATCWIVASEKEMIEFAIKRVKLTVPQDAPFFMLKELIHNKIELNNGSPKLSTKEIPVYKSSYQQSSTQVAVPTNEQFSRHAFAEAWEEINQPDDVGGQVAGNVDSFRSNVVALPAPTKQEETKKAAEKPSFSEITAAVINDMPDQAYSFLEDAAFHRNKHKYSPAHICSFRGRNIVQLDNKDYVLYGPVASEDNLVGVAIFHEDEIDQIITTEPRGSINMTGTIDTIGYKRIVEDQNQLKWKGFGFVILENVKAEYEESHPSC